MNSIKTSEYSPHRNDLSADRESHPQLDSHDKQGERLESKFAPPVRRVSVKAFRLAEHHRLAIIVRRVRQNSRANKWSANQAQAQLRSRPRQRGSPTFQIHFFAIEFSIQRAQNRNPKAENPRYKQIKKIPRPP